MRRFLASALFRTALLFALISAAGSAAAFLFAYSTVSAYTRARVRDTIETDLRGLAGIFEQSQLAGLKAAVEQRAIEGLDGRTALLVSGAGEKIAGNFDSWPNTMRDGQSWFRFEDGGRSFDGAAMLLPGNLHLMVAHGRAEHEALLAGLRRELALPGLAALLAALAAGLWVSRRIMARVDALNAACRAVEGGDMAARAPGGARADEFGELARGLNAMLERIAALMRGVHVLSDHVAHEMRTPLARLRSRLERARRDIAAEPAPVKALALADEAFDSVIGETEQIIGIFTALLDIAAAESAAGDARGLRRVDLAETLAGVADLYEGVAEDKGVALSMKAAAAVVLGEPALLMRMVANVVDNAIKFSPPGSAVALTLAVADGEAVLTVADSGPGIAPGFAGAAFERFSRAAQASATPGHGLGLPLVRAIALRHGMRVALEPGTPALRVVFRARLAEGE